MKSYISMHNQLTDPMRLDETSAQAAAELLSQGESPNTRRSYQSALRYWAAWFALRYQAEISVPVAPATVIQFIVDHVERQKDGQLISELPVEIDAQLVEKGFKAQCGALSLATLKHRLAVLSQLHRLKAASNPCDDPAVRQLLARTRRAYAARGVRPHKMPALTLEPLGKLLETCDESLRGRRDKALLLFALASGGRRRSEIASATVEQLQRQQYGEFVFVMGKDKTHQSLTEDPAAFKPVTGDAGLAMEAWLTASGITQGTIFRRIRRGGKLGENLNPASVRQIVIDRARQAGLSQHFSAHSLRSGFMTEAGLQDVPLAEAMNLSGHASVQVAMGYFRAGNVLVSRAGKLFNQRKDEG